MSYEARNEQQIRDREYNRLKDRGKQIVDQIGTWVADNANLQTDSTDSVDKQDVIDQRTIFDTRIDAQLGR